MTFTYNFRPTDSNRDAVRFHIQDTDAATCFLHDEEIDYLIGIYGTNLDAVCSECCEIMASRYAKKQEVSVANYNMNMDSVYKKLMDRAQDFRVNSVTVSSFRVPALSVASKQSQVDDTDNVVPSFRRDLMDNPIATNPNVKDELA
jgi:hypothetical protein